MALQQYTRPVDGTIPISALLYNDEELLASQDNTGIYDGLQKSTDHQSGAVHVTTHRLFFIDARPRYQLSKSFAIDLGYVTQTAYYAGLFTSSPKVTIYLASSSAGADSTSNESVFGTGLSSSQDEHNAFESWECEVCGNKNPPGLSPTAARVCSLCGVPRSSMPLPVKQTQTNDNSLSSSYSLPSAIPSPSSSSPSLLPSPSALPPVTTTKNAPSSIPCAACTFLNHPALHLCEICSMPLPRTLQAQPQSRSLTAKSAPSTRAVSPIPPGDPGTGNMIKLSFRRGGDKAFYAVLKRSLLRKGWEGRAIGKGRLNAQGTDTPVDTRSGGIHGIMRTVENSAKDTSKGMSDALQDLEALRVKAKDMVRLAAELNERLTAVSTTTTPPSASASSQTTLVPSSTTEPEEATFIRSSLSQLGLQMQNAPVTLDMIRDERKWVDELARELAGVLVGTGDDGYGYGGRTKGKGHVNGMMRERGIVALDEVWGGWNRARGVALIPPSTFLSVLPHLPFHTDPPIRTRTFPSGLTVLHTPQYTAASFTARLSSLLTLAGPKTTGEIAKEEELTIGLTEEMIGVAEMDGAVCRDEGAGAVGANGGAGAGGTEVTWWPDLFTGYKWDGQD